MAELENWRLGTLFEQRAVVAGLCEPDLLANHEDVAKVLRILDQITRALVDCSERKSEGFRVLRQALGYCWSVAVAAMPAEGSQVMEKWLASTDKDVRWVMKENLQKKRLAKVLPQWVEKWRVKLIDGA